MWHALEAGERGAFWCQPRVAERLRLHGVTPRTARPKGPRRLVCVAGAGDVMALRHFPTALLEHGAGQAYDVDDPGWSGGSRRDSVVLFLCPNPVSAARNAAAYPRAAVEVVGSPRVDSLMDVAAAGRGGRARSSRPAVAFGFHWMGTGKAPEAGWALPHYEQELGAVVEQLRAAGAEVLGHGHPRQAHRFARMWRGLGVEWVARFDDVVARASTYVCDNSSTMFEAAACGIPVVVLNAPWYRRDVSMWPRFWQCADVGPQCDNATKIFSAVVTCLDDPPALARRRAEVVAEVYPLLDGGAARRAAHALLAAASSLSCTP